MDTRSTKRPLLIAGNNDDDDFQSPPKKRVASENASVLEGINRNRAKIALLTTPTKRRIVDETKRKNIGTPKSTPKRIQPMASNNIEPSEDMEKGTSPETRVLRSSASPVKLTPSPKKLSPAKISSPKPRALKLKVKVADKRNATPSRNTPSREVDIVLNPGLEEVSARRNLRSSLSPNKLTLEKTTPQPKKKSRPKKKAVRNTSLSRTIEDRDEEERTRKKSKEASATTKKVRTTEVVDDDTSTNKKTFRSGLSSMVTLFKELNEHHALRVEHDEKMKSTPFGSLYCMFRDGKLSEEDVRKPSGGILSIMSSYSREDNAFSIGGKLVQFKVEDVAVTFGLPVCGKKPRLSTRTVSENCQSEFVNRYWPNCKLITSKLLTSALRGVAHKDGDKDVEDFCKMVIMFMLLTIFNPGSGSGMRLSCIPLIDDFQGLGQIGWAQILHENLDTQIRNWKAADPFSLTSCSVLLLYFLLEHSDIVEPKMDYDEKYPRCAKWSFEALKTKLKGIVNIKSLKNVKVTNTLTLTDGEKALIETVFSIEDTSQLKISSLEKILDSLNDRNVVLEEEIEKLKMLERTAAEDTDSLRAEISLLQYRLQQGALEIERLNGENKMLRDKISNFEIAQNPGNQSEIEEGQTPLVNSFEIGQNPGNQSEIEEEQTPLVNSRIRELKAKTRKKLVRSGYEYQEVGGKRKKTSDDSPEPKRKSQKLPRPQSSPYWQYFSKEDQTLIADFFKNNMENCTALIDAEGFLEIIGRDIKNILFDEFISQRVIDWFGRYLIKVAESSSSSDQYKAEIFPSSLFGYLLDKTEKCIKKELDDRVQGLNFGDTEALMFPIIHRKNAKDKEGYHWSLLVLDTTDWSWSHYDSLRPRKKNSKSKTLDDAILYKSRIASTIKLHKSLTKEEKQMVDGDVNVEPCPQQGNTVNCAIYVCHYMKSLFVDKTPPHETDKEGAESVKKLKVDICCNILKEKATRTKAGHH